MTRTSVSIVFTVLDSAVALAADDAFAVSSFQICIVEKQGHWLFAFVAAFRLGPSCDGGDGVVDACDEVFEIVGFGVHRFDFDGNGAAKDTSSACAIRRCACCSEREFDCLGQSLQHSAGTFDSEFSWSGI